MPRDYQRTKNNQYWLPGNLYREILCVIRDYDRLKDEHTELYYQSSTQDGMPRGSGISNPTERTALKLAEVGKSLEAVDQALICIDEFMRFGVMSNIKHDVRFPPVPSLRTWGRVKAKFIHDVAYNLHKI